MPKPEKIPETNKSTEKPPQMVKCAVIPEAVYYAWLDSYRDALIPPKASQPVMEGLRQVQFAEFPYEVAKK